jgi:ABC-type lipoprotein export system ATPase subunit
MKTLTIKLENCYGIKKLDTKLDFTGCKAVAIYAPNGVMKSSLAQTFRDVASKSSSKDRIFPSRQTVRSIIVDETTEIAAENVLVISPFDETFGHNEKTSTLLVEPALRQEYEKLYAEVDASKEKLVSLLKAQAQTKRDVEVEISALFTRREDQFVVALRRIQSEIEAQKDAPYGALEYDRLFEDKAQALFQESDFKTAVAEYVQKYNELLDASEFFDRETFNYYNAGTIAKTLADHGFFKAKHTVILHGDREVEVKDQAELTKIIDDEKKAIMADKALRDRFAKVQKLLHKNAQVREFESYLLTHEGLLSKLENPEAFKEEIWKSYIKVNYQAYIDFLNKVTATDKRRAEIEDRASRQGTQWEEVIRIFNERFFVPFKLVPENIIAVRLGREPMLRLGFEFHEGTERAAVDKATLMQSLSTGEKKAFYILNVIFEIETRAQSGVDTLLVVDDVADSFDYKNKYAIIQYLKELEKRSNFEELLLTHNFDFYRTVESRFVSYKHCLVAEKTSAGIVLKQATGIRNVFVNDWKGNFATDAKKRIASIPFIRNLVEYTKGDEDPDFVLLTSLLHWKADSAGINQAELDSVYNRTFSQQVAYPKPEEPVVQAILSEADGCLRSADGLSLENKIILAIAARLKIEQFMIEKIGNTNYVGMIDSNQTHKLQAKFKEDFPDEKVALSVIDRVLLMTPENIHLNSFMYEPLIDMSGEHLRKLYSEVAVLQP